MKEIILEVLAKTHFQTDITILILKFVAELPH